MSAGKLTEKFTTLTNRDYPGIPEEEWDELPYAQLDCLGSLVAPDEYALIESTIKATSNKTINVKQNL